MATLMEGEYELIQEAVNTLFTMAKTQDEITLACKAVCWVTHSHYDYENCLARCSQCKPGDRWSVKWGECRKSDETPDWLKELEGVGGDGE